VENGWGLDAVFISRYPAVARYFTAVIRRAYWITLDISGYLWMSQNTRYYG
jgi:hypothetical protein